MTDIAKEDIQAGLPFHSRVSFGLRLPNSGPFATAGNVIEAGAEAEDLGYDILWVHDHISWTDDRRDHFAAGSLKAWDDQDPNFYESLSTLSFIAGRTSRVMLGVSGLSVPLRDPRVLARQMLTLHALSGGRFIYAVGIGGVENDFDVLQVPWKERGRIADEYMGVLDAAFSEETLSSFHGERVKFDGAGFFPKPRGLRRWIVGGSRMALRRTVRFGSGWLVAHESPEEFAEHMDYLAGALAEQNRSIDQFVCGPEVFTAVEDCYEAAYRLAAPALGDRLGTAEDAVRTSAFGTPTQVAERIQQYVDLGARHVEFKVMALDFDHYMSTVRRIAREVIPRLKAQKELTPDSTRQERA